MKDFLQKVNSYIKEAFSAGKYLYDGFTVTLIIFVEDQLLFISLREVNSIRKI